MKNKNEKLFRFIRPLVHYVYDSRCCLCGVRSLDNHVHHCNWNHDDNSLYNLAIVCDKHHKMIHKNKFALNLLRTREQENFLLEIQLYIDSFDLELQESIKNMNVNF